MLTTMVGTHYTSMSISAFLRFAKTQKRKTILPLCSFSSSISNSSCCLSNNSYTIDFMLNWDSFHRCCYFFGIFTLNRCKISVIFILGQEFFTSWTLQILISIHCRAMNTRNSFNFFCCCASCDQICIVKRLATSNRLALNVQRKESTSKTSVLHSDNTCMSFTAILGKIINYIWVFTVANIVFTDVLVHGIILAILTTIPSISNIILVENIIVTTVPFLTLSIYKVTWFSNVATFCVVSGAKVVVLLSATDIHVAVDGPVRSTTNSVACSNASLLIKSRAVLYTKSSINHKLDFRSVKILETQRWGRNLEVFNDLSVSVE